MCVVARLVNVKMVTISNLSTTGYLNNKTRTIPTPNDVFCMISFAISSLDALV
jgi:hypothetical protein